MCSWRAIATAIRALRADVHAHLVLGNAAHMKDEHRTAIQRALGLGGVYLLGIGAAALQALWHYTLIRTRTREGCFKAFRLNHWVGFAVFAGVALDLAQR